MNMSSGPALAVLERRRSGPPAERPLASPGSPSARADSLAGCRQLRIDHRPGSRPERDLLGKERARLDTHGKVCRRTRCCSVASPVIAASRKGVLVHATDGM